ncbi:MAG: capsular biosynthesis protein [Gammaproteobacteria bacterium]|nr:capsular biosynthesis protein [Gammaproteobacteria bacterium]
MKRVLVWLSPRNLRIGLIAIPWLAAAAYLHLFAADRYVSESIVAIRSEGQQAMPIGMDALSALFGSTAASREDQHMLAAHILSMDMLRQLDERLDLREHFSRPRLDFVFALDEDATQEEFLEYYRKRVEVKVDPESGLLTIRTQGFTPELAQDINRLVVEISERFINESSHRLARDQMRFAEGELQKAREALDEVRSRLTEFQRKHGVLDPSAQAMANTGLTAELQAALARQEAELKALLAYLNDDAPQVQALEAQIAGLRAQLETERLRGLTSDEGTSLNVLVGDYQELLAELEFVQDAYRGALTALETARIESTRKLKSLVLVESPALPESAEYPRRAYVLFALLMGLLLVYGIGRLIVATIEDHLE